MIRIKLRKNLVCLFIYFISSFIRDIVTIAIELIFFIDFSFIYLYLMILGEIIGGLSIYLYQSNSIKRRQNPKYFGINLYLNKKGKKEKDSIFKIGVLLFFASFFDIYHFYFRTFYKSLYSSKNIYFRFSSILTIASSLICTFALGFKMKKHHKFSLIMLTIFLCLTILIEAIFISNVQSLGKFLIGDFIICYYFIGNSFCDCIEKYLFDENYMNPFIILLFEGLFNSLIAVFITIFKNNPFYDIIDCYNKIPTESFILLIFLLFIYFILSMIVNSYKIYCNVIYSPMARSLIKYLMNPFFNIYFFYNKIEFNNNYIHFILSEFISLIVDFFGCIYNEYIIIYCCNLEYETKDAIIERAFSLENSPITNPSNLDGNNYNIIIDNQEPKDTENDADKDNISLDDMKSNFSNISFDNYILNK